jgi:ribosomal protein S14
MRLAYLRGKRSAGGWQAHIALQLKSNDTTKFIAIPPARAARQTSKSAENLMTKLENRCANCGGKFGLICHHHRGLRFCRKACEDNFLAKTAKDYACMRKWFGLLARGRTS